MKFFKWSIVPTKLISDLVRDIIDANKVVKEYQEACNNKKGSFLLINTGSSYVVYKSEKPTFIAIKEFHYNDDKEYAFLCANELLEHLTEKI